MGQRREPDREIADRVRRGLEGLPYVLAAYVFGSRATGRAGPASDTDVAVLTNRALVSQEKAQRVRELAAGLGRELAADRLDIVILNDAPPVLAFQVLKHGALALCRDEVGLHRFKVATYRRHADREPIERLFREATKRRARKGTGGG